MPSKSVLIAQAFSKTGVLSTVVDSAPSVNTGQVDVATAAELPSTGNTQGDFAFVQATNRLYIWNGSGWYNIALINTTPTWDSNGQPASSYVLSADSPQTATTITLAASDPEGIPISYNYITGGSMDSIATISQDSSVFTITPKTSTQAPDGGTGSITFRATDSVNILPYVSSFTLNFISIVENSRYTTLLATATGTSDNNNITDASTNNHTITVNGDAYAGTFSPYRHGGYSTYFPDTAGNAYVSANSSDYALGSGALTVSAWIYIDNNTQQQTIIDNQTGSGTGWYLKIWPGQLIRVHNQSSYIFNISNSDAPTAVNEWIHLCWTRDGSGNNKLFLNGTQVGTTVSDTTNFTAQGCKLGETYQGVNDLKGYIKDVHIVAGYANEPTTSSIATAVTSDTGTVFLGCSGPDFLERSSSPKTITINGNNIFIRPFSPYDYNEYDAADHGGSVYFDGTGDNLDISASSDFDFGTGDFTFEMSFYAYATSGGGKYLITNRASGWGAGVFQFMVSAAATNVYCTFYGYDLGGYAIVPQTWNHLSAVKSGDTITLYLNGITPPAAGGYSQSLSGVNNVSMGSSSKAVDVGSNGTSDYFKGYIGDLRIVKGTAITPPAGGPTSTLSSTGAALHIKGTDASIIDKSQGTNLLIDGTTITGVSTGSKYSKAIKNTAASSAIKVCTPSEFNMRTNDDFTIEFWFKVDPTSSYSATNYPKYILQIQYGGIVFGIWANPSTTKIEGNGARTDGSSYITWSSSMFTSYTPNQWHHYALSFDKSNTTAKWFLDGSLYHTDTSYDDPSTSVTNSNGTYMVSLFGETGTVSSNKTFIGSIEDFRFSQFTRYTANFTPPTAPLEC
jgi:hypothetical protein